MRGGAAGHGLADLPVVRAARGDLRRVGDDEDLRALPERLQPAADGVGGGAADAAVDLVEDQRQAGGAGAEADLEREQEARELAARGDAVDRAGGRRRGWWRR